MRCWLDDGIGNGVKQNVVTAYAWHNIAAAAAHNRTPRQQRARDKAKGERAGLARKMTPDQIAKAQELSNEMIKKNPKLLN